MLKKFFAYLKEQIGNIYVWGAQGQTLITEDWIRRRETSTTNANRAIAFWKKRLQEGAKNLRAFDCSGLLMYYLQNITGMFKTDLSANSLWKQCDKITRAQVLPGDWVFRGTSARKSHIGVVVDELNVIEAYGRDRGVIMRPIDVKDSKGKAYWQHFGRPRIFKAEIEDKQPNTFVVTEVMYYPGKGKAVVKGAEVMEVQRRLAAMKFYKGAIDGLYGPLTEKAVIELQKKYPECGTNGKPDGRVGPKTTEKLGGVWAKK